MVKENIHLLLLLALIASVSSQCCSQIDAELNICLKCPSGMHLFRDNCILDIPYCAKHVNGFDCEQCSQNYKIVQVLRGQYLTKRCKPTIEQIQINLENPIGQGIVGQAYLIADDYARSVHFMQLQDSITISGTHRKFQNGQVDIVVEYQKIGQGNSKKYYRFIIKIDTETFFLEQKQFKAIAQTELRINTRKSVNEKKNKQQQSYENLKYTERNINLFNPSEQSLLSKADNVVKSLGNQYEGIIQSKLRTYSDGTQIVYLKYVKEDGSYEEVVVHIGDRIVLSVGGQRIGGQPGQEENVTVEEEVIENEIIDNTEAAENSETENKDEKTQTSAENPENKQSTQTIQQENVGTQQNTEPNNENQEAEVIENNESTVQEAVEGSGEEIIKQDTQETAQVTPEETIEKTTEETTEETPKEIVEETPKQTIEETIGTTGETKEETTETPKETIEEVVQQNTPEETTGEAIQENAEQNVEINKEQKKDTENPMQNIEQKAQITQKNTEQTQPQNKQQQTTKTSTQGYTKTQTNNLLRDLYFIVTKDFINKQYEGYNDILPTETYTKTQNNEKYFIMIFKKQDQTTWQITSSINLLSYKVNLISATQLQSTSNNKQQGKQAQAQTQTVTETQEPTRKYTQLVGGQIFKNFYFLITIDKINTWNDNKYANYQLKYVGINEEDGDGKIVYFRIVFKEKTEQGAEYEIVANINKKTFKVEVEDEKEIVREDISEEVTEIQGNVKIGGQSTETEQNIQEGIIEINEAQGIQAGQNIETQIEGLEGTQAEGTQEGTQTEGTQAEGTQTIQNAQNIGTDIQGSVNNENQEIIVVEPEEIIQVQTQQNIDTETQQNAQNQVETSAEGNTQTEAQGTQIEGTQTEQNINIQNSENEQPVKTEETTQTTQQNTSNEIFEPQIQEQKTVIQTEGTDIQEATDTQGTNIQQSTDGQGTVMEEAQQSGQNTNSQNQETLGTETQLMTEAEETMNNENLQEANIETQGVETEEENNVVQEEKIVEPEQGKEQSTEQSTQQNTGNQQIIETQEPIQEEKQQQIITEEPVQQKTPEEKQKQKYVPTNVLKPREINPLIIGQVTGFTQVLPNQKAAYQIYQKIDEHIRKVNPQLQGFSSIAAFVRNVGFSRSFKIYYEKPGSSTYQAYASYDIFRNRIFIINFGTVGYSIN